MPKIKTADGAHLYYEEAGTGTPVVFVHEFAGDYRTWEPQMRRFARSHRLRHLQPARLSAIRRAGRFGALRPGYRAERRRRADGCARYRQSTCRRPFDGRLYGAAYRHPPSGPLHFGDRGGLRLGLARRSGGAPGDARAGAENAKMFTEKTMAEAAAIYADGPTRNTQKYKDPRGYAEFVRMLSEHSSQGHALTMAMLQSSARRCGHGAGAKRNFRRRSSSSSATRTRPVSTAASFSSAPRRPRASW